MTNAFDAISPAAAVTPITGIVSVTPSDTATLAPYCRAINVAAAGNVNVTTIDGTKAVVYVSAGIWFPIRATQIWATSTTATGIVAGF